LPVVAVPGEGGLEVVGGEVGSEHWRKDEMKPTFETLARRYVEARDEVARLKRERAECECERAEQEDSPMDPVTWARLDPCWKAKHETEIREDGRVVSRGGWEYGTHPADWCDSCKRRQAIHVQIRPAQQRMAARLGAIVSATRASCFQNGKE